MLFNMGQLWSSLHRKGEGSSRQKQRPDGIHSKECNSHSPAPGRNYIPGGIFKTSVTSIKGRAVVEFPPRGEKESSAIVQHCMEDCAATDSAKSVHKNGHELIF